ncbi:MAG: magnesium protoporphyrin IX methyltransferase [Rhodobacteraceae bacterium]|nr:magnesium protoporphyrin IX methyltransferase [Paracoccaceae bacterium]
MPDPSCDTLATASYRAKRGQLETYFDRTASEAWARLTSEAPVSRIRATVRAGRDAMRARLLSWLPEDLSGARVLDAGCGAGQFAVAAAERGAEVVAVDVAGSLVDLARERAAETPTKGSVRFEVGDMLDPAHGRFDHVVAMDSLIHYGADDIVGALRQLAARAERSILFTVAPRTPALSVMHAVGKVFPRSDRAPQIAPVRETTLRRRFAESPDLADWALEGSERISNGFYVSQAMRAARR